MIKHHWVGGEGYPSNESSRWQLQLAEAGFVRLPDFIPSDFDGWANHLGQLVPARVGEPAISSLRPLEKTEAHPHSQSALYGRSEIPFHTDGAHFARPPSYVILWNPSQCELEVPTRFFDVRKLPENHETFRLLRKSWVAKSRHGGVFIVPLTLLRARAQSVRFDRAIMRPASGERIPLEWPTTEHLPADWHEIHLAGHEAVLWDNTRLLHGRGEARNSTSERLLRRAMYTG